MQDEEEGGGREIPAEKVAQAKAGSMKILGKGLGEAKCRGLG